MVAGAGFEPATLGYELPVATKYQRIYESRDCRSRQNAARDATQAQPRLGHVEHVRSPLQSGSPELTAARRPLAPTNPLSPIARSPRLHWGPPRRSNPTCTERHGTPRWSPALGFRDIRSLHRYGRQSIPEATFIVLALSEGDMGPWKSSASIWPLCGGPL